ncbi:PP2C family protein-serine/threonine phosphatase [Mycoplasmopsis pulmonis]|uniref:PP2C family protein-serine/threonine phosphatase n=1 Tax=Mycoplasmopsis pulmonis TaxID=2107 RepID=UPI0010050C00|nr:PP2C family serine/threonine-protein phosphatase [Mycoplasmopsis pulmonis]VEU68453.1 Serine/threonine phosphatase stp [Mycoplasmopsis pulmonis]
MDIFKLTDTGTVREENQDRAAFFQNEKTAFLILCDGMGGHFGGSLASSITVKEFEKLFSEGIPSNRKTLYEWFEFGLKRAREKMKFEAGDDVAKNDMGTTVTAALVFKQDKQIYIFNVGDSRTYVYNGLLHQVTIDHNLMNHYIRNSNLDPTQAASMPGASALTSALGPKKKTSLEVFEINEDSKVEYLILTSDGIHDFLPRNTIERIVRKENVSLEWKTKELIKEALIGRSTDNLTVIIMDLKN